MTTLDRRTEVRALSELGLTELGKASAGIHDTHRAVSDRIFAAVRWGVGPVSAPVKAVHDVITDSVYRIVGESMTIAGSVGGRVGDLPLQRPPSTTKTGAAIIAAVNGVIGDELDARQSPLAEAMSLRVDGVAVEPTADALARAYPGATGRIVVAVHGLVETEYSWAIGESEPYGPRLAREGVTTVFLRYNTGRHISTNGRDLAELLDEVVRRWPVPVESIGLLGHSMGGLVARSAAHYGRAAGHSWVHMVTASVSLGTPHLGAPLEGIAHHGSAALMRLPETRAFGRLLRRRSGGIRDLRGGSIVDEDWTGRDPDDLARAVAAEVELLPGAEHYFVSATVTANPRNPLSRIIGDGLVLHHSASGDTVTRRIGFAPANGLHLGKSHHFTLLNDERVADKLVDWFGPDEAPTASDQPPNSSHSPVKV
ncbi:PGAP1-like alpha/beta domain-containing protein [Gordonia crocea]|uniref:Permease n=1 Tax=Gordonia crocea TaxID=589162 RepID=A0A7I9UW93_9ACTN|nr:alpha/beta fold hydrolase [Gordonia crocea]GED97041.1 permease [Gordonia crocea]